MRRTLTLVVLLVTLSGCLPMAVHPFYTQDQLVFDEDLLGSWRITNENAEALTWRFSREGNQTYFLHITDNQSRTAIFHARLFKLGERQWLDILPQGHDPELAMNDWMRFTLAPMHAIMALDRSGDRLQVRLININRLEELAPGVEHMAILGDKRIAFTGSTAQTQQWLKAQMSHPEFLLEGTMDMAREAAAKP